MGRFPGTAAGGATFHIFVDPTIANGLAYGDRKVDLTLELDEHGGDPLAPNADVSRPRVVRGEDSPTLDDQVEAHAISKRCPSIQAA